MGDECFSKNKQDEPMICLKITILVLFSLPRKISTIFLILLSLMTDKKLDSKVYKKPGKLPMHRMPEIPTKWKRDGTTGVLHRTKRISSDFNSKIKTIVKRFFNAGYPKRFLIFA